ncbi:MAG: tetratricopeptide repeat protein, partial [Planctomycetota bacterium]
MHGKIVGMVAGLTLLGVSTVCAQHAVLDQMYGNGVHAYFSQDYQQAHNDLTDAIEHGSVDPRCYYYRGLCYLKTGRDVEAGTDFQQAAQLEAQDINRFYNVGRALERIQGRTRLKVEQYRAKGRADAMRREEQRRMQRYGEIREAEQRVLETQAKEAPPTPPTSPAAPTEKAPAEAPPKVPTSPPSENPFKVIPIPGGVGEGKTAPPPADETPA